MIRFPQSFLTTAAAAAMLALGTAAAAPAGGAFPVQGERLDLVPPSGWVLTEVRGEAQGSYVLRYEPEASQRANWKNGYLTLERLRYPDKATLESIRAAQGTVAGQVVGFTIDQMQRNCGAGLTLPPRMAARFGTRAKSVQAAFCSTTPASALGESLLLAAFEGEDFVYRVHFVWQPQNETEREEATRKMDGRLGSAFMTAIEGARLCGDAVPCRTVIVPPRGAAAVAAATDLSGVAPAVQAWASAWSAKDLARYMDFYAASFQPPSGSVAAWKSQRASRVAKPGAISVTVEDLQVRVDGPNGAQATFKQTYRSNDYVDVTQKTLRLVREGEAWKIRAELATPTR